jgi:hypothetical protein
MKINMKLTFAALAALAVTLLFQNSITLADNHGQRGGDNERRDRDHRDRRDARATFTKWVTGFPNQPGRIIDMEGVVGGVVGHGTFTGEVLLYNPDPTVSHFVAFYHFTGPKHSFTALVDVLQTGSGPGTKAAILGVVTDGWLKGQAVKGEYTEGTCGTPSMPCFTGTLEIDGDCND